LAQEYRFRLQLYRGGRRAADILEKFDGGTLAEIYAAIACALSNLGGNYRRN
jgi:uncharacterized protein (DUF433 family)